MRVSGILASKGATVATISPRATVAEAADALRLHGIGALVVSSDGRTIEGIVSERDVVRAMAERGDRILHEPVSRLMSVEVWTCAPEDSVEHLMRTMTERRTRHLPVTV